MNPRLASPALADRGARFAGVGFTDRIVPRQVNAFPAAQPSQAAAAAAPSGPSPDGAAFSHFTESCPRHPGQDKTAPVVAATVTGAVNQSLPVGARGGDGRAPAVGAPSAGRDLSHTDPVSHTSNAILLPDHMMILVRAIAAYERCGNDRAVVLALLEYSRMIGAGPLARAVADLGTGDDGDLADVPDFARGPGNRFRGGGP